MKTKARPVGTIRPQIVPDDVDTYATGDKVRINTGEELMVIAIGATGWLFQSLNGRGKPFLTADELGELGAEFI